MHGHMVEKRGAEMGLRKSKSVLVWALLWLALVSSTGAAGHAEAAAQGVRPSPLYLGVAAQNTSVRTEMSREAEALAQIPEGSTVEVLAYEPSWLLVVYGGADSWVIGYVLRHTVYDVQAIAVDTPAYGSTPARYTCVLSRSAKLYDTPSEKGEYLMLLAEGTKLAVLRIEDGWAEVIYRRQLAYFYLDAADALEPVYDLDTAGEGDTIAAFVSFFSTSLEGLNANRIHNIELACEFISMSLAPGESFSMNGIAGPYRQTRGYLEAPSFVDGETVPSYGGGTCQVSSTLYNVLLPIKGSNMVEILYRVAHGPSGAVYLPHGVDAACGNTTIDLRFRNDFPFSVRIEAEATEGVLYIALCKEG